MSAVEIHTHHEIMTGYGHRAVTATAFHRLFFGGFCLVFNDKLACDLASLIFLFLLFRNSAQLEIDLYWTEAR